MAIVTKTQLENAALDAATLQAVVNGSASPGTVTSRLGTSLSTVAKVIEDLANTDIGESAVAVINQNISAAQFRATALAFGAVLMSETDFENLLKYEPDSYYAIESLGIYHGGKLIFPGVTVSPGVNDLYVSPTGDNSNNGSTPDLAKLTILNAFNTISNSGGKTIWLATGTYSENLTFTNKSFTNPVVIRALPGHTVTLRPASGTRLVIFSGTCQNIKFRNVSLNSLSGQAGNVVEIGSRASYCGFYDCEFIDPNSYVFSMSLGGGGGTTDFDVKRSRFVSGGNWTVNVSTLTNARFIANDMQSINGGIAINGSTLGGNYIVNQNLMRGSIVLTGGSTVVLNCEVKHNDCLAISHTGGTNSTKSVLTIDNNSVNSTGGGIVITGYTTGGSCSNNVVLAASSSCIAWPNEGATNECDGHTISGNIVKRTGSAGYGIIVGVGSSNVTVSKNEIDGAGSVNTLVITGSGHTVTLNRLYGGASNAMLLKGCSSCTITGNVILNDRLTSVALNFAAESAILSSSNTITGNTFTVSNGQLYLIVGSNIGTGNNVNSNSYQITENGIWGSMFTTVVGSLVNVRAAWTTNYASSPNNDNVST